MKRLALLLVVLLPSQAQAVTKGGQIAPDGKTSAALYLPPALRMWNTGGSNGAGLCVYSAVTMAARYQNEEQLFGLRKWAESRPGGSWPEKLKRDIDQFAPAVQWMQSTARDYGLLQATVNSGRMPSVSVPGHMVNVIHADEQWVAVLDNNGIYDRQTKADNAILWYTQPEWMKRWQGWVVVLLHPGPPPSAVYGTQDDLPGPPAWRPSTLTWTCSAGNPSQVFCARNGVRIGGYDYAGKWWRDYRDGSWYDQPAGPPFAPPEWGTIVGKTVTVEDSGCWYVPGGPDKYTVGGVEVDREECLRLLGQNCPPNRPCPLPRPGPNPRPSPRPGPSPNPSLPDDQGKLHLTVVGDAAKQVTKDLASAPELAVWKDRLLVQDYRENDPMLVSLGLPATGFHVLVQLPNSGGFPGKIVANYTSYAGPAALASALAEIQRKADPVAPVPGPAPALPPAPTVSPAPATPAIDQPAPEEPADVLPLLLAVVISNLVAALTPKR